jgi:hypothetical protein
MPTATITWESRLPILSRLSASALRWTEAERSSGGLPTRQRPADAGLASK